MKSLRIETVETCEGTACARCRMNIAHCACNPIRSDFRAVTGMAEAISGQGWVPETAFGPDAGAGEFH